MLTYLLTYLPTYIYIYTYIHKHIYTAVFVWNWADITPRMAIREEFQQWLDPLDRPTAPSAKWQDPNCGAPGRSFAKCSADVKLSLFSMVGIVTMSLDWWQIDRRNIRIHVGPQPCLAIPYFSIGILGGTENHPIVPELETNFTGDFYFAQHVWTFSGACENLPSMHKKVTPRFEAVD